jgi:hypothetical protein
MVYGEDSAPILLTLDEVNKKVNELYSSELISGIEKYLKPFVKDQLIKDIENIYKEKINNKLQTYLNDLEAALKNFETAPTTQSSTSVKTDLETKLDDDSIYELDETDRVNIFTYNDQLGNKEFYKGLVDINTDVVFIRNNVNTTYKDPKKNFGGQQELDKLTNNMTMNITTSLTKTNDNFVKLPKSAYKDVLRLWEEEIAHIQAVNDSNSRLTKIAFPNTGFGDPALMPQELFVYLSKRLFDAFSYVNPGSVMYNQMNNINIDSEGITNEEILEQLGLEEDPFKNCE